MFRKKPVLAIHIMLNLLMPATGRVQSRAQAMSTIFVAIRRILHAGIKIPGPQEILRGTGFPWIFGTMAREFARSRCTKPLAQTEARRREENIWPYWRSAFEDFALFPGNYLFRIPRNGMQAAQFAGMMQFGCFADNS
jgi:hypothetical protein